MSWVSLICADRRPPAFPFLPHTGCSQGLSRTMAHLAKSAVLRVARVRPWTFAVLAIRESFGLKFNRARYSAACNAMEISIPSIRCRKAGSTVFPSQFSNFPANSGSLRRTKCTPWRISKGVTTLIHISSPTWRCCHASTDGWRRPIFRNSERVTVSRRNAFTERRPVVQYPSGDQGVRNHCRPLPSHLDVPRATCGPDVRERFPDEAGPPPTETATETAQSPDAAPHAPIRPAI